VNGRAPLHAALERVSSKIDNHVHAVAIHSVDYDSVRVQTLQVTPEIARGLRSALGRLRCQSN
jgi:hypothetical protein